MTARAAHVRSAANSFLSLVRSIGERDFSARQKAFVQELHLTITDWIGGALARFEDPSPSALSHRARQILRCLLEGDGDKQIAMRVGIRPFTVNQYVKVIFTHFGVSSRSELLARWIRRGWAKGFAWDE